MNEKQNLSSLIWNTADDILRGLFKPSEYGRIILPFVVLRRLDCVLEPQKDKAYKLHEKYKKKLKDFNQIKTKASIEEAIKSIDIKENDIILITGSLYLAGEVLSIN